MILTESWYCASKIELITKWLGFALSFQANYLHYYRYYFFHLYWSTFARGGVPTVVTWHWSPRRRHCCHRPPLIVDGSPARCWRRLGPGEGCSCWGGSALDCRPPPEALALCSSATSSVGFGTRSLPATKVFMKTVGQINISYNRIVHFVKMVGPKICVRIWTFTQDLLNKFWSKYLIVLMSHQIHMWRKLKIFSGLHRFLQNWKPTLRKSSSLPSQ